MGLELGCSQSCFTILVEIGSWGKMRTKAEHMLSISINVFQRNPWTAINLCLLTWTFNVGYWGEEGISLEARGLLLCQWGARRSTSHHRYSDAVRPKVSRSSSTQCDTKVQGLGWLTNRPSLLQFHWCRWPQHKWTVYMNNITTCIQHTCMAIW